MDCWNRVIWIINVKKKIVLLVLLWSCASLKMRVIMNIGGFEKLLRATPSSPPSSKLNCSGWYAPLKGERWGYLCERARDIWLHAQGLTLAALAGAALVEYYDQKAGNKTERYDKFLPADAFSPKD